MAGGSAGNVYVDLSFDDKKFIDDITKTAKRASDIINKSLNKVHVDVDDSRFKRAMGRLSKYKLPTLKTNVDSSKAQKLEAKIDQIKAKIDDVTKNHELKISAKTNQLEDAQKKVDLIKAKLAEFTKQNQAKIDLKVGEIDMTQDKADAIQDQIDAHKYKIEVEMAKADEIDDQIRGIKNKLADKSLGQTDIFNLKNQMSDLIAKNEEIMAGIAKMDADPSIKKLESQFAAAKQKIKDLNDEIEKLQNMEVNPSFISLNNQLESSKSKVIQTSKELENLKNTDPAKQLNPQLKATYKELNNLSNAARNSTYATHQLSKHSKKASTGLLNMRSFGRSLVRQFLGLTLILRLVGRGVRRLAANLFAALKTNDEFKNSLAQIKSNLTTAFMPIYNVILPAINALMSAISTVTSYIASFFAMIFGTSVKAANNQAKAMQQSIAATKGQGSAAKKAAKDQKKLNDELGALTGFDQLNDVTISEDKSGSSASDGGGAVPLVDVQSQEANIAPFFQKIKEMFDGVAQWANEKFGGIWSKFISDAGVQLERTKGLVQKVWNDIQTLGSPLKSWFGNEFTALLQTLLTTILNMTTGIWDSLNTVFMNLWNIVIFPFLQSFTTTWLPMITDAINGAVDIFNSLFDEVKRIFDLIWSGAIAPALEVAMQIWTDFSNDMKAIWDKYATPLIEEIKKAIKSIGDIIEKLWKDYFKPVWDFIIQKIDEVWTKSLRPFVKQVVSGFMEIATALLQFWNGTVKPLVMWLLNTFKPVFDKVWNGIKTVISKVVDSIGGIINGLRRMFQGIVDFVVGVFTGDWKRAWDGIKGIFAGFWQTLKTIVKGGWDFIVGIFSIGGTVFKGIASAIGDIFSKAINWIIGGINEVIRKPFDFINWVLNSIRNFDIPLIGRVFSGLWRENPIPVPQIPKIGGGGGGGGGPARGSRGAGVPASFAALAKGGVLTEPTLALAGEYAGAKSNPEIVTPQNIMFETMQKALAANQGNGQPIDLKIMVDSNVLYEAVLDVAKIKQRQLGREVLSL